MSQTKIDIANLSDNVVAALSVPKISGITYPGDDTAAAPSGGQQITVNGSGFAVGALVYVDNTVVGVSSVVSGTQIVFTSPAKVAGSYELKVLSTDGGSATFNNNIQYSGTPVWATAAGSLATVYETSTIANTFSATSDSAVTYTVTSGSLPAGGSLNSSTGALTGAASSVASSTTYSFTVDAVDAEQQETPRNFSYTINPDVVTWSSPADGVTYTSTEGNAFTQSLSATSAAGKTISYSANALPAGLSITGSNIAGTFSAATTSSSLITATAATTNKTATRTLNWSIAPLFLPSKLYTWGMSTFGVLGLNDAIARSSPTQVSGSTDWTNTAGGIYYSVAIKNNGTLWTWGGAGARLGLNGVVGNISSPMQVGSLGNWKTASGGDTSTFAIKTDGTLWSWGNNASGVLGLGNATIYSSPKQVGALTVWKMVAGTGANQALAIKTDGTLWSWGSNSYGALGLGNTTNYSSPKQVGALTNWSIIGPSRGKYIYAIKTDGTLWSWGNNYYGQLGLNDRIHRSSPVQVGLLTTWKSMATSENRTSAITTSGTLWSWGNDGLGELGLNATITRSSPVQVGTLNTWKDAIGGGNHTMALKTDGTIWVWGRGGEGQLGLGDTANKSSPVQVGLLTTWNSLGAGQAHSMAISS